MKNIYKYIRNKRILKKMFMFLFVLLNIMIIIILGIVLNGIFIMGEQFARYYEYLELWEQLSVNLSNINLGLIIWLLFTTVFLYLIGTLKELWNLYDKKNRDERLYILFEVIKENKKRG